MALLDYVDLILAKTRTQNSIFLANIGITLGFQIGFKTSFKLCIANTQLDKLRAE